MRRHSLSIKLLTIGFFMLNGAFGQIPASNNNADKKPNIIFILTDDQRWDALGYAGTEFATTPEMDKLAKEGTYFRKAISTTPICAASRASIISGLYERTHKYTFETGNIREEYMKDAYPVLLKQAGYHTGFFGKFGVKYDKMKSLFDVADNYDRNTSYKDKRSYFYKTINKDTVHLTRYTGQQGLDFIEAAPGDQPFCLQLSFSAPHAQDNAPDQYFWQKETDPLYQNMLMPAADLADDKYFNALPEMVKAGFSRLRWTWRFDTPEKYQHSVKGYYRMIAGIDLEIAKIRMLLQRTGLDKNTIIIVMSDNGYFLGERQIADKWLMYDQSIRVPLIVYDPRANKHFDSEQQALNIDVPATILQAAGVKIPSSWQGKSLLPLVQGKTKSLGRDTVLIEHLWEFNEIPPSEGVRTNDWKYFRYVNDKANEELYNLRDDPKEIRNLSKDVKYSNVLKALKKKCDELIAKYKDPYSSIPQGLMTNFIRDPRNVFIQDSTPGFTWLVPKEAVYQSAYQVLVASSKANIDNNVGDAWNSTQVRSGSSSNIIYNGERLREGQHYYWKVRVWDQDNRISDYSPAQTFRVTQKKPGFIAANSFQIDRIKPVTFVKKSTSSYFIDFGKDAFATLEITYTSPKPDSLIIHIGEQLNGDKINRTPQGSIRYQRVKLPVKAGSNKYLLPITPDTRNTKSMAVALPDTFPVLMPFRYCEIENVSGIMEAKNIAQLAYHSYFDDKQSSFYSSDSILNKVWDLCKYSIKATTFAGIYVDGDRERIPYEADAYLNQLSHYTTDKEYAMARSTIEYFMQNPTWPTEWQLHVAMMVYQDYMYTGNTSLIKKYYEQLKHKTLIELAREDGLISTSSNKNTPAFMRRLGFKDSTAKLKDIVDWPPAQKDTDWKLATENGERDGYVFMPVNTMVNGFFYKNMQIMAELAKVLNRQHDALAFEMMALKVKQAINEKLYNVNTGAYVDGEGTAHSSLHANMTALAFDIVPEDRKKDVVAFIKSRGMACSVYGAQYLLEGLYNAGEQDYALELMTATHDRSWWNMIKIGSTITLEAWDMKYKPNADWNHAWGAVPASIVARDMWGIKPKTPGAAIVSIKPQLGKLSFTRLEVPFINGIVKASYQVISPVYKKYVIELPANMVAEMELSKGQDDVILLNGEKTNAIFKTIRLSPGINTVELKENTY